MLHVSHLQSGVARAPSMTHTGMVTSQATPIVAHDVPVHVVPALAAADARDRRGATTWLVLTGAPIAEAPSDDERGAGLARRARRVVAAGRCPSRRCARCFQPPTQVPKVSEVVGDDA